MSNTPMPLTPTDLLAHAREAARADERRHGAAVGHPRPSLHSEDTVRGWGGASLHDLEYTSQYTYSRERQQEYRHVYAEEYRRARALRTAQNGV